MTNILEGVQFSTPHVKFPHWNPKDPYVLHETYSDWKDIPAGTVIFDAGTRFRIKPKTEYHIYTNTSQTYSTFKNKNDAMSSVANLIDSGKNVKIVLVELSVEKYLAERKLQYCLSGSHKEWINYLGLGTQSQFNKAVTFRIRPDFYHVVDSLDSVVQGSLAFHDIEDLAKYVDSRIRTNGLDFSVKRVKY